MDAVISFALRQRLLVLVLFLGMLAGGAIAFAKLNIEAYPDPVARRCSGRSRSWWSAA